MMIVRLSGHPLVQDSLTRSSHDPFSSRAYHWVYDTWAQRVAGQPVIQPKASEVEGQGVDGQHAREFNAVCTSHIKAPCQSNLV